MGLASDIYEPKLAERIDHGVNYGSGFEAALAATYELVGYLESGERRVAIFERPGPKLALASMHSWIHGAAAQLWTDGYHREAVNRAASVIFDTYLPDKLRLPNEKPEALVARAFKDRQLTIPGWLDEDDLTNAYQGAQYLGLSCYKLVRNLRTHNQADEVDEAVLLEELAMLSRFARLIEDG